MYKRILVPVDGSDTAIKALVAASPMARDGGGRVRLVGTHGRRGFGRVFLGSGAEQIISLAPVPVLVIRSTDVASRKPA